MTQVVRITHVCSKWRALGLLTSILWTRLGFDCQRSREIEIAKVWLSRLATSSIIFEIHYSLPDMEALSQFQNMPVIFSLSNRNHDIFNTIFGLLIDQSAR